MVAASGFQESLDGSWSTPTDNAGIWHRKHQASSRTSFWQDPGGRGKTTVREEVRAPLSAALVLLACTPNAPTLFRLRTPSEALGVSLAIAQKAWISVLLQVSPPAKLEHSPCGEDETAVSPCCSCGMRGDAAFLPCTLGLQLCSASHSWPGVSTP